MTKSKPLMVLTGAGISVESGIPTFRDSENGLWKGFDPMVLANYRVWRENFDQVHEFYNDRRSFLKEVKPNATHYKIAEWQDKYEAHIYTTNIDRLHEQAGARKVHHVHGCMDEMRCEACDYVWNIGYSVYDTKSGCPSCGSIKDVKPNVVFFNEMAPLYDRMYDQIKNMGFHGLFIAMGGSGSIIPIDDISRFLDCPTVLNVLDLEPFADGYLPPISPSHWTHCFFGKATEQVLKIDELVQKHFAE